MSMGIVGIAWTMGDRRHLRRFTLIETLVAFALLSIVAIGVYQCVLTANRMMLAARLRQEAQNVAVDQMWAIFNEDYARLLMMAEPLTASVPTDSPLHGWDGSVRTAVYVLADHCTIEVRVDWRSPYIRAKQQPFERVTVDRYPTVR